MFFVQHCPCAITAAAAKYLTPTVLELGGQGPAVLTASANVELAAKRIANLKVVNVGQVCLGVNHVFVDPPIHDRFVEKLRYWFEKFLEGPAEGRTRIVNDGNYERLVGLLDRSQGLISYGGNKGHADKILRPAVFTNAMIDGKYSPALLPSEANRLLMPYRCSAAGRAIWPDLARDQGRLCQRL